MFTKYEKSADRYTQIFFTDFFTNLNNNERYADDDDYWYKDVFQAPVEN